MNLSLHDPQFITADFPTTLNMTLSYGHCTALQISPCGHYIASGLLNGAILIIDTWSNNVTTILRNHTMPIVGLKWIYHEVDNVQGRDDDDDDDENIVVGLVSWARDWKVCLHGLRNHHMKPIWEYTFPGGIWNVDVINTGFINEKSKIWENWKLVICRVEEGVCFAQYTAGIEKGGNYESCVSGMVVGSDDDDEDESDGFPLCCCKFFGGKYIVIGTSKGWLQIIDVARRKVAKCIKICGGNIKGVCIVERGYYEDSILKFGSNIVPVNRMIVNSSDRILRQYDINNIYEPGSKVEDWAFEIEQKYQDVVNRIQWNTVTFSPTGEYVCASTQGGSGAAHDVYVWETSMGSLVQILEGAHEELIDVDWGLRSTNGNVCCIAANGMDSGTIYMWGVKAAPKWSALAPDFEEIEQNIEYIENEDEFDLVGTGGNLINEDGQEVDEFDRFIVDVVTKEETDARGFKFIKGCIIDTNLEN